jgi:dihydrofolate reductase
MAIIGIVAVSRNLAIGKNGRLPWHFSEDLKHFKQTTTGNAILMGKKTFDSLGKPLQGRLNIVLSSSSALSTNENLIIISSVEQALCLSNFLNCDLFVIGGAKTFEAFHNYIDRWIVTRIPLQIGDADCFMPENFLDNFELVEKTKIGEIPAGQTDQASRDLAENDLVVEFYEKI